MSRTTKLELLLAAASGLAVLAAFNALRVWRMLRDHDDSWESAVRSVGCGDPSCRACYPLRIRPLPTSTALAEAVEGAAREVLEARIVPPPTEGAA